MYIYKYIIIGGGPPGGFSPTRSLLRTPNTSSHPGHRTNGMFTPAVGGGGGGYGSGYGGGGGYPPNMSYGGGGGYDPYPPPPPPHSQPDISIYEKTIDMYK
jgi:hypothetical protein